MKRASYREGVRWIAANDNAGQDRPGDDDVEDIVSGYVSTLMLADLFDVEPERVARDVMRERRKMGDQE
jgi:hypothetical protein